MCDACFNCHISYISILNIRSHVRIMPPLHATALLHYNIISVCAISDVPRTYPAACLSDITMLETYTSSSYCHALRPYVGRSIIYIYITYKKYVNICQFKSLFTLSLSSGVANCTPARELKCDISYCMGVTK